MVPLYWYFIADSLYFYLTPVFIGLAGFLILGSVVFGLMQQAEE